MSPAMKEGERACLYRLWLGLKIIYVIFSEELFLIPADEPSTRWDPMSQPSAISRGWLLSWGDARQPNPAFVRWGHMIGRNIRHKKKGAQQACSIVHDQFFAFLPGDVFICTT